MNLLSKMRPILVAFVVIGFLLVFFGVPAKIGPVQIVDPQTELNSPEFKGAIDDQFGERVINSTWAMVLVHSEFSGKNAGGLEALRNWAKEQFIQDRQFLNPLNLPHSRSNVTVIDSFLTSLFGLPASCLEYQTSQFLKSRVNDFQQSSAFQSFRIDYYELFGVSQESAKLLSRYQEERAKESINVLLGACFWFIFGSGISIAWILKRASGQTIISSIWLAFSAFYFYCLVYTNSAIVLTGAILSLFIGLYIAYPLRIVNSDSDQAINLRIGELSYRMLTLAYWLTISLVVIQVVNWIKGGIFTEPDPITLLIGAITGNFLHDPVGIKRSILEISGVSWTMFSLWSFYFYKRATERSSEIESELKSLARQKISIQ